MDLRRIRKQIWHTSVVLDVGAGFVKLLSHEQELAVLCACYVDVVRLAVSESTACETLFPQDINNYWLGCEDEGRFSKFLARNRSDF